MVYLAIILVIIICLLVIYTVYLRYEIRSMGKQLLTRVKEGSRQPVTLALIDKNLGDLAAAINNCLKVEEELRINAVKEENRIKEMIADISHDLRTPLTAVRGYLELMEKGELDKNLREKLQIALKHAASLGNLIERFFEYSYYMNVEPDVHLEKINVNNLVTDCILSQYTAFEEKNLEVEFEESDPVYLVTDRELLTRIVMNLTSNCLRHSAGKITAAVVKKDGISIIFKNPVADPLNINVDRLFSRFYTGDKARGSSTGLGLSIVELLSQKLGATALGTLDGDFLEIKITFPGEL